MDKNKVSICLICDDGCAMPASVAMTSMVESKNTDTIYNYYIVYASLDEENVKIFEKFNSETVAVNIIRQDVSPVTGLHTSAALLKFILPEIIDCDKLLYLDNDLIVREDLTELFSTDITDRYLAAAADVYVDNEFVSSAQDCFDCGVMVLNLDLMRREKLSLALTKMKQKASDLTDRNIFSCVCGNKITALPVRYNFLPANLAGVYGKCTLDQINDRYNTSYKDEGSLFADAAIIRFPGKAKPWENNTLPFADDWYRCYLKAPVEHTLKRSSLADDDNISPAISVIIPVYNSENYIEETIDSILAQTLKDIEILAIDDGSADKSQAILNEIAGRDSRVKVYHQENKGQGTARNFGIRNAKGKYIYFIDSDDIIEPDTLQLCYETAQWNNADLVLFEGMSFFDKGMTFDKELWGRYGSLYHRKKFYPGIYSGEDLYCILSANWDFIISACMRLYSRKYIVDNNIFFPEDIKLEDNFFAVRSMVEAQRVKVLNKCLYKRRLRENSTMTGTADEYKKFVGYHETACRLLEYMGTGSFKERTLRTAAFHTYQWFDKAYEVYDKSLTREEKALADVYHGLTKLTYSAVKPVLQFSKKDFFANLAGGSSEAEKYKKELDNIRNSASFRAGRIITWLPGKIKNCIKYYKKHGLKSTLKYIVEKLSHK